MALLQEFQQVDKHKIISQSGSITMKFFLTYLTYFHEKKSNHIGPVFIGAMKICHPNDRKVCATTNVHHKSKWFFYKDNGISGNLVLERSGKIQRYLVSILCKLFLKQQNKDISIQRHIP